MAPREALRPLHATALVVALLAVSSAATLFKLSEAPPLVKAFYRLLLSTLLLAPFALFLKWSELRGLTRRDWLLLSGVGAVLALHFATWIASLDYTSVASSLLFVTIHPVLIGLAAPFLLKERTPALTWVGIVLALGGSAVIAVGDAGLGEMTLFGDALAFAGAVAFAVYLLSARSLRQRMSLLPYTFVVYGAASLTLLVLALLFGDPLWGYPAEEYGVFLALAVIPMIFGHTVINWVVKYVPATLVSVTILGEPIVGSVIAYLVFSEAPSTGTLVGGALVLAGLLLAVKGSEQTA
ncbi:MAG TPA: DMT family transporter [Candidatus Thermoplasmatota archaeon]|nr:DMT family transporter [Candidatus Thermoplasmatota archaeon]